MSYVDKYATAAELLADFRSRDIRVWQEGDQVAIDPKELLTKQDRSQISLWKVDIIGELENEMRRDPALQHTCPRVLERELTARPGVLNARVWENTDGWALQVDFEEAHDHVFAAYIEIRDALSGAVQKLYDGASAGRVHVYEDTWFHYNWGEPPAYTLRVKGLALEAVVAEAKRLEAASAESQALADEFFTQG